MPFSDPDSYDNRIETGIKGDAVCEGNKGFNPSKPWSKQSLCYNIRVNIEYTETTLMSE